MSSYLISAGDYLARAYGKTFGFAFDKLSWYPDGVVETRTFLFIVEKEYKEFYYGGNLKQTVKCSGTIFDRPVVKTVEFLARRVLGSIAVVVGTFTIFPLGYIAKNAPAFCSKVQDMVFNRGTPKTLQRRID